MPQHKIWFRVEPEGEDPHTFSLMLDAPSPEAAIDHAQASAGPITFQTWRHFNEIKPTWVTIWQDPHEDTAKKTLVTATEPEE